MDIILYSFFLVLSIAALVKSADIFTHSAEKVGLYMGLSSFIVGATIVAIGSSMPEIATSVIAMMGNNPQTDFAINNVIGSNIANCLLVGGVAALFARRLKVQQKLIDVDLPFFFMSTGLFLLFIMDGQFTMYEGIISLCLLAIFMAYTIFGQDESEEEKKNKPKPEKVKPLDYVFIIAGMAGIYFSADFTITNMTGLANVLGINPSIVTMLGIAIGTSLPELIVSVQAVRAGKHSVAIGNIFGSNTFNALAVVAIPSFIAPLSVSAEAMAIGVPVLILASFAFIFSTQDDEVPHWEAAAFLLIYLVFCLKLVGIL